MMDAPDPDPDFVGCHVSHIYKTLGVKTDSGLTFKPRLQQVVHIGRAVFRELHHVGESIGLPFQALASQVLVKAVPIVLLACELLVLCDGAEAVLNRLQAQWAKSLLGVANQYNVRGTLAVKQCG